VFNETTSNFIKSIIQKDLKQKKYQKIITRFAPEPNGFLHIGHARAIVINFELASIFGGETYLRYDDTNPKKENKKFLKPILEDIKWLGYNPKKIFFASDYFDIFFKKAILLIKKGKAFIDDLTPEELKKFRGDLKTPGINSPYRNRSIEENLELFQKMQQGFFRNKQKTLRAKIDMSSPNINLRDPVLYRSLDDYTFKKKHYFIFPSYDFAHPLEDSIEGITHSLCSSEFEEHRILYDWVIINTEMKNIPKQIEFGRLNITQTILSKRHLKFLVDNKLVKNWDDPRMPTLVGMRKKGYTPTSIKKFIEEIGLSKNNNYIDKSMLDASLRNDLQKKSKKAMAILEPLKLTIINYPENKKEFKIVPYFNDLNLGFRKVFFSKHIYIEKKDFQIEKPDKKYKKLFLNGEVRLFYFYFIKAIDFIKNKKNQIIEIIATYDPKTKSGSGFNERKPNGTIHFVEMSTSKKAIFNFYGPLFENKNPKNLIKEFNYNSWIKKKGFIEGNLDIEKNNEKFQFLRQGFFNLENKKKKIAYFNEVISLKQNKN
jgi:glutaminyl-tRNA synthetase